MAAAKTQSSTHAVRTLSASAAKLVTRLRAPCLALERKSLVARLSSSLGGGSASALGRWLAFSSLPVLLGCPWLEYGWPGHGGHGWGGHDDDCEDAATPEADAGEADAGETDASVCATCFVGDLTIVDAASASAASAYTEVIGDLVVAASVPLALALPALTRVSGSVTLALPGTLIAPTSMPRCGLSQTVRYQIGTVALPALTEIGGDLTIEQTIDVPATTAGEPIELGLPALVDVEGNVSITFAVPAPMPCGIAALSELPGDLTLDFASGDVGGLFLGALADVAGLVTLRDGYSVLNVLPVLTHAGSLRIENATNLYPSVLPLLSTVDTSVELVGIGSGSVVGALTAAGSLSADDTFLSTLSNVGSATLTLGGLVLTNNSALASLSSSITLAPTAPFTVAANPALAASDVCSFVAAQQAQGWTGPLTGATCP